MSKVEDTAEEKVSIYDYIYVAYKYKFIVFATIIIIITLASAVIFKLFFQKYRTGYTYNKWNLTVVEYELLLDRFYSQENIDWLISGLQQIGCEDYATMLENSRERGRSEVVKYINFKVWPENLDNLPLEFFKMEDIKELADFPVKMVRIQIIDKKSDNLKKIGKVVRDNIEECLPIYNIKDSLTREMIAYRENIALIQKSRRSSELEISRDKIVLEKLAEIKEPNSSKDSQGVVLQIDISEQGAYMPIEYQTRAAKSNIILAEESIAFKAEEEKYYESLLELNMGLIEQLRKSENQKYSITNFLETVEWTRDSASDLPLKDNLSAFCQEIENVIERNIPATQTPRLQRTGGLKKVVILSFMAAFAIGILLAFLIEGMKSRDTNR